MSPTTTDGPGALLLFPGAGAGRDHRTLVALEKGLDLPVTRADFPYRREGRKVPWRATPHGGSNPFWPSGSP